jgi:hypothetical protein
MHDGNLLIIRQLLPQIPPPQRPPLILILIITAIIPLRPLNALPVLKPLKEPLALRKVRKVCKLRRLNEALGERVEQELHLVAVEVLAAGGTQQAGRRAWIEGRELLGAAGHNGCEGVGGGERGGLAPVGARLAGGGDDDGGFGAAALAAHAGGGFERAVLVGRVGGFFLDRLQAGDGSGDLVVAFGGGGFGT